MRIPETPFSWKLLLWLCSGAVVVWGLYLFIANLAFSKWQDAGVFGDTFGALSALFSVLAFCGVLFSLLQDRKERSKSGRIEAYDALLRSIENQLRAAQQSGAEELVVGELLAKQRLYSEELETLITNKRPGPLISDEEIADAFAKIPWFKRGELLLRARGLRERLIFRSIVTPQELQSLVENQGIIEVISHLYTSVLGRDPKTPFDPDALAVWGGLFLRQGITDQSKKLVETALRKSQEYKKRYM